MSRASRLLGFLCIGLGLLTTAWLLTTWLWQDPVTAAYTRYEQHRLSSAVDTAFASYHPVLRPRSPAARHVTEAAVVAGEARRLRREAHRGQPLGRIVVPRLGLHMVFLNGADEGTLKKGPGRYLGSAMPGEGRLVYIAGHRTTYLAPFSHIDQMRKGDRITLELPYATFVYRVTGYRIVPAGDVAVLRSHGHEVLALQACEPRFSASHRYIVYALPARMIPRR